MTWKEVFDVRQVRTYTGWWIFYKDTEQLAFQTLFHTEMEAKAHAGAWFKQNNEKINKILLSNK